MFPIVRLVRFRLKSDNIFCMFGEYNERFGMEAGGVLGDFNRSGGSASGFDRSPGDNGFSFDGKRLSFFEVEAEITGAAGLWEGFGVGFDSQGRMNFSWEMGMTVIIFSLTRGLRGISRWSNQLKKSK